VENLVVESPSTNALRNANPAILIAGKIVRSRAISDSERFLLRDSFWFLPKRPSSNSEFWDSKLDTNLDRDLANLQGLEELGWSSLVIWECETKKDEECLSARLNQFLSR
jgi:hypothetical protein